MTAERPLESLSVPESTYTHLYLERAKEIIGLLDREKIEAIVDHLARVKDQGGRLFVIGVGGSAANCAHAVNDFRKISGIEAYAPTDNVAELTARTNDEGWETVFSEWLKTSRLSSKDAIMVFSVGGGSLEKNVSTNIVRALQYSQEIGATILGIVSRDGGYTGQVADVAVIVPPQYPDMITPIAESFQALVWHGIANHPKLKIG